MKTPHDRLFRGIFSQPRHARSLLRVVLPEPLRKLLDLRRLRIENGSYIDERLREQETDLLIRVQIGGNDAYIYVLLEHQSKPQELMPVRLVGYLASIWADYRAKNPHARKVPMILPIVIYHGTTAWSRPVSMDDVYDGADEVLAVVGEHLPRFAFVLIDLLPDDDDALYRRVQGIVPQVILWALTYARREPDLLTAMSRDIGALLRALAEAPSGVAALTMLLTYTMSVARIETERMAHFLKTEVSPMAHQMFTNTYDEIVYNSREEGHEQGLKQGREQGLKQGREQGLKQGREQGLEQGLELLRKADCERLIRLLRTRFGRVPRAVQARIKAAGKTELDGWYERLLVAESVADIMGDQP